MPAAPSSCQNFWDNYDAYTGSSMKCAKPTSSTSNELCGKIFDCWKNAINSGLYCSVTCALPGVPTQQVCRDFLKNYESSDYKPQIARCAKPTTPAPLYVCRRYSKCFKKAIASKEFCSPSMKSSKMKVKAVKKLKVNEQ